ncbi:MAG: hypothetical protein L0227_11710 [Chloroflexi bacterium]|nr:hypothetical protein [Chloroflexota bacterium]
MPVWSQGGPTAGPGRRTFTYDWANRELTATSPFHTGSAAFGWRLDGLLGSRLLLGDSDLGTYSYDAAKRVTGFAKAGTVTLSLCPASRFLGHVRPG